MGRPLYTNNAATYLAFGITNTATTMQVSANAGSLFPNPTGGDYFYVSLISLSGPIIEIVKCTTRSGDILTIERGQEGTSALYWNMGDNVQLRITAAGMNYIAGSTASTTLEQSFTATQGQTVFTLTNFDYAPGTNNLAVFVNGSKQVSGTNYSETSVNVVTFTTGLNAGDVVEFLSNLSVAAGTIYATDINYNEGAAGAVTRTLESKLQETVSVKDFGAVGDGVTDDTTAIQAAISSGAGVIVFPPATYIVSPQALTNPDGGTGICINVPSNITLSMYGATIKQASGTSGTGGVISNVNAVSNVNIIGGTIDGNESSTTGNMNGILLLNATNCLIQNVSAINTRWIALGFRNPGSPAISYGNNSILNCYVNNCLYIGIQCTSPILGLKIIGNTVNYTADNAIDINGNNPSAGNGYGDQIIVSNNSTAYSTTGLFLESVGNSTIDGNNFSQCSVSGIYLNRINSGSFYNVITGNTIESIAGIGIYINNSGTSIISNNLFKTVASSFYLTGGATFLSIGKNLHTNVSNVIFDVPQGTNNFVYSKIDAQDYSNTRNSSGFPFTSTPLGNATNYSSRSFDCSIAPTYFFLSGASSSLQTEYQDGNSGTLTANSAWGGAYSVYTGGQTLIYSSLPININTYITINSALFLVYSNPSGGVYVVRECTGTGGVTPVDGNYTATTNGAYPWVEYYSQWQTT